jgi:drug/metabolite transporter (DMT)-like permease
MRATRPSGDSGWPRRLNCAADAKRFFRPFEPSTLNFAPCRAVAYLAFIFCSFVWGTSFILLERVTHVMGPVEIAIWRLFSGAAVVGFCWWLRRGEYRLNCRDFWTLVFSALVFTAPPQLIQSYVLSQGFGHSFFGTMVAAIPLLTILVSIPMLGVLPTGRELFGVLGGLVCIFMLVEEGVNRGMSPWLLTLTLTIPLSSAVNNTFIKWRLPHVPAAPLTTVLLVVAGVALVPLQFSPGAMASLHVTAPTGRMVTPDAVVYLVLLGIIGSGVSTMVFIWMVLKKGPLFAGMTTYVVPVLALLWGTLDREMISPLQMIAIVGVLSMVMLVQTGAPKLELAGESAAGNDVTSLPISAEVELLARMEMAEPESQVA